ncbi:thioesterase II family protein [Xenorhabdus lircayensis]|uniref:thioesterase II family protein n=1 Tax=Xenorhabdus lircayensis TaxID=2763499 RepID=UPI001E33266E|nr:hypothetical protein [Xenorhabdus lircayensis]
MNGTTDEVLLNNELMNMVLPVLRADFKMAETYQAERFILKSPITVLSGDSDPDIKPIELHVWSELSNEDLTIEYIPGDPHTHRQVNPEYSQIGEVGKGNIKKGLQLFKL